MLAVVLCSLGALQWCLKRLPWPGAAALLELRSGLQARAGCSRDPCLAALDQKLCSQNSKSLQIAHCRASSWGRVWGSGRIGAAVHVAVGSELRHWWGEGAATLHMEAAMHVCMDVAEAPLKALMAAVFLMVVMFWAGWQCAKLQLAAVQVPMQARPVVGPAKPATNLQGLQGHPDDAAASLQRKWMQCTVVALKGELCSRGLPVTGLKKDLVERLVQHELEGAALQHSPCRRLATLKQRQYIQDLCRKSNMQVPDLESMTVQQAGWGGGASWQYGLHRSSMHCEGWLGWLQGVPEGHPVVDKDPGETAVRLPVAAAGPVTLDAASQKHWSKMMSLQQLTERERTRTMEMREWRHAGGISLEHDLMSFMWMFFLFFVPLGCCFY